MGAVRARELPTSKYPNEVHEGYAPAPLDQLSMDNGVRKFNHQQFSLTTDEANYALSYLRRAFPLLENYSFVASDEVVNEQILLHEDKSSGFPFSQMGCPKKRQAFETFGLEQIESYYRNHLSVVSSTLKDELRPLGKDARFFRPQDVSSYVEGVRLFYYQNEYLMRAFDSPVFCKYTNPGPELAEVFRRIQAHSKFRYAADGSSWDANFPISVASVIATFRSCVDRERVQRYYRMMYNGVTDVQGRLLRLVGQPSGHFLTSVDNCLCHMVLMAVHAYRRGLSLDQFESELLFYCCGDDLIWSSVTDLFNPHDIDATYSSLGVYLEYEFLEPKPVGELSFCGASPVERNIFGVRLLSYYMSHPKCKASLRFVKRKSAPLDTLGKICSIAQLFFMNEQLFNYARALFFDCLAKFVAEGKVFPTDPNVLGFVRAMEPLTLARRYTGFENSGPANAEFKSESDAEAARND